MGLCPSCEDGTRRYPRRCDYNQGPAPIIVNGGGGFPHQDFPPPHPHHHDHHHHEDHHFDPHHHGGHHDRGHHGF